MSDFWTRWLKTHGYSDKVIERWKGNRFICPDCGATETLGSDEDTTTAIICPYCMIRDGRTIMVPRLNNKVQVK